MRSGWVIVLGLMAATAAVAFADDESDRNDLERKIDDKLGEVANDLGHASSASSSSDIEEAVRDADELKDTIRDLDRVKGDDDRAKNIVDRYPDYIRSLDDAARAMHDIKDHEFELDARPNDCKDAEQRLQETIRDYVGNATTKANEGLEKLPELAQKLGDEWRPRMEQWQRLSEKLADENRDDHLSISDGRWSDVSSNMNSAAYQIFDHWTRTYDATKQACERLAKGKDHPDVVKALADLATYTGNVKQTYKQLEQDYRAWWATVKELKALTDDDRKELREIMCTAGEYELDAKVKEVADRWQSKMSSAYGSVTGQADRLIGRADSLVERAPKSVPKLKRALADNLKTIDRIKDSELRGYNDPAIQTRLRYGNDKHKELQAHCDIAELPISSSYCTNRVREGSGCRLDCVLTGSTCSIHEIKPNTTHAIDEGKEQLASYKEGLENWYKQDRKGLMEDYPKLAECEHGEGEDRHLELKTEIEPYEFCPKSDDEVGASFQPVDDDVDSELQR
ncbi:MAG TPA: hypothetical protein VL463_18070 [Kofleriaceae bacterium]|nr:hypothetical protein [Kofleriaceae bacterium]